MIQIAGLSHCFSDNVVISYPDWQVADGEHSLILGASGSGKTTLLHLMSGLLKPTNGSVIFDTQEINQLSPSRMDKFRGAHVGLIFQKPHLIAALTVKENIKLSTFLGKKPEHNRHIEEMLDSLGLIELAHRKVHQLSQGQAQRVAIARALINHPKFVFGDEPTASLDDESCMKVVELLKRQSDQHGATLVIATHDQRVKNHFSNKLEL
ncbi:ABC transporter ATP-binding protein [Marinoscillum sp. MHG1-6]|uniref:ABC transporter ATP-binding protein n=1 Tax=Marinoscillum sp. MHG1-6 TaxID=2959627 RepID=UPI00215823D7|nr:ABC transporter ATP-binding protein [Marinoscillum sp. MHG1-6]